MSRVERALAAARRRRQTVTTGVSRPLSRIDDDDEATTPPRDDFDDIVAATLASTQPLALGRHVDDTALYGAVRVDVASVAFFSTDDAEYSRERRARYVLARRAPLLSLDDAAQPSVRRGTAMVVAASDPLDASLDVVRSLATVARVAAFASSARDTPHDVARALDAVARDAFADELVVVVAANWQCAGALEYAVRRSARVAALLLVTPVAAETWATRTVAHTGATRALGRAERPTADDAARQARVQTLATFPDGIAVSTLTAVPCVVLSDATSDAYSYHEWALALAATPYTAHVRFARDTPAALATAIGETCAALVGYGLSSTSGGVARRLAPERYADVQGLSQTVVGYGAPERSTSVATVKRVTDALHALGDDFDDAATIAFSGQQ